METKDLKIVIAGGGSTYTPGITQALLNHRLNLPFTEYVLYDIDPNKVDDTYTIVDYMLRQQGLEEEIKLSKTLNPEEAFTGADFIFSQIRVGGLKMREKDEKIPLKYGLVGQETCGLGGFSYGLRSIKGYLELLSFVEKFAPNAWILNYTNPESLISSAAYRAYPHLHLINACDMTISIEETIARNFGYDRKNWIPTYYGLNHFGWYQSIYDKSLDRDIMPELIQKIQEDGLQLADFNAGDKSWQDAWDMLQYMVIHFPHQIPNNYLSYYLYPDLSVQHMDPNYSRANMVMDGRERNTRIMAKKIRDHVKGDILSFNFGEHGNYIVDMATSILHDSHQRFMLIVRNNGAIPNLRSDAMVEIPAYVGRKGVEPVSLKPIPDFHKGLMEAQSAAEILLVDAYFNHSYQSALEAFTLNQSVPSAEVAKKVLDDFIAANGDYWPELH